MTKRRGAELLTDAELELMLILWERGEGSVHDVLTALPPERVVAYTTASTVLRILEKKGFVGSRKEGKAHIYLPLLDKGSYEARTLGHVVSRLFDRSPASLVARLVQDENLSETELADIRALLERLDRKD